MEVTIKTENGTMRVRLDQFLPDTRTRVRKLFRLMAAGMDGAALAEVRGYLEKAAAGDGLAAACSEAEEAGAAVRRLDRQISGLKYERDAEKGRLTKAKAVVRRIEMMREKAPVWIGDFDAICGGKDDRDQGQK